MKLMKTIETEILIESGPEQVWARLIDFERYSEWNPFIRHIVGEPEPGSRLTIRIHPPEGKVMTFQPRVRVVHPGKELRWLGHFGIRGLFDGEHIFRIETNGDAHVRFLHSEHFRGVLVSLIPNSLFEKTRRGFEQMNQALKREVEIASLARRT